MTGTAMTAEFGARLRPGPARAWHRRRGKRFRRQRGADGMATRHSDAVAIESPGQTLEAVLSCAWEDLETGRRAECPVCGGQMLAVAEAGAATGRCGDCGSELG